jgi:hypothetical protein
VADVSERGRQRAAPEGSARQIVAVAPSSLRNAREEVVTAAAAQEKAIHMDFLTVVEILGVVACIGLIGVLVQFRNPRITLNLAQPADLHATYNVTEIPSPVLSKALTEIPSRALSKV